MSREAMQLALNKMRYMMDHGEWYAPEKAIAALEAALAEKEPEPDGWLDDFGNAFPLGAYKGAGSWRDDLKRNWRPLYASPPTPAEPGVVAAVINEVQRATRKYPTWPADPLHALAVLGEEFGELTKAMLQLTYEPHKTSADEVRSEAIQTAAMSLRLLSSLDRYTYKCSEQHAQDMLAASPAAPKVEGTDEDAWQCGDCGCLLNRSNAWTCDCDWEPDAPNTVPARLTDEEINELCRTVLLKLGHIATPPSYFDVAIAIEAEVRRRCGVVE